MDRNMTGFPPDTGAAFAAAPAASAPPAPSSSRSMGLDSILNSVAPGTDALEAALLLDVVQQMANGTRGGSRDEDAAVAITLASPERPTAASPNIQTLENEASRSVATAGNPEEAADNGDGEAMRTRSGLVTAEESTELAEEPTDAGGRPTRAAAVMANVGMARQAQDEAKPLGLLVSSALPPADPTPSKKRPLRPSTSGQASKRVALTNGKKTKPLESASTGGKPPLRGKKRRQAATFAEAAPIITDLPPLPFTTRSPSRTPARIKNKAKPKPKPKRDVGEEGGGRACEFCKKTRNTCALMHCTACRRVYHAQCFVAAFKPFVREGETIADQMARLQLEVPERRGNIFRCASCKAAFVDFVDGGGHVWDCQCPTCTQPEKALLFRQRKVLQMMADKGLERQRKRDQAAKNGGKKSEKPPAVASSRSRSDSHSRRVGSSSPAPEEQRVSRRTTRRSTSLSRGEEVKAEAMEVDESGGQSADQEPKVKEELKGKEVLDMGDDRGHAQQTSETSNGLSEAVKPQVLEPQQQQTQQGNVKKESMAKQEPLPPKVEPEVQPELAGVELLKAVRLRAEGEDRWCFPVVCSRTPSLNVSGMMKTGTYKWEPKRKGFIVCECCNKCLDCPEFVHHTDSNMLQDPKAATDDPMSFLFVEHCDHLQYTPLRRFVTELRSSVFKLNRGLTAINSRTGGHHMKQEALAAVVATTTTMTNPEAAADALPNALARLRDLALFKRPKSRSEKAAPSAGILGDPPSLDFLAYVVCLAPKYVMSMANGSLVDRILASETPGGDSFPRKAGWLAFSRKPSMARTVTCACCHEGFTLEKFVEHAGIEAGDPKLKPRHLVYVMKRQDPSALLPYSTFLPDLELAATNNVLDPFLDQLQLQPPSPRPT
ncbi:hypothetical protein BBJ28_00024365 [Nothophytophthora sp. Chile5]|nr:hypothetical protein BBJ28_00024365 [Nothophytophthora sp. Chile5]